MKREARLVISSALAAAVGIGAGACGGGGFQKCSDVSGTTCTWAGVPGEYAFNGDGLDRRASDFYWPMDLTFAPDGRAWIVDWNNHRLRRVESDNTLKTMEGNHYEGDGVEGVPRDQSPDTYPLGHPKGAPGPEISLNHPDDVVFLPDGIAIVAAWHNNKVREVFPDGTGKTLAGSTYGFQGDGGPAAQALLYYVSAVAVDDRGRVYVIDQDDERIRVISSATIATTADGPEPEIKTLAGDGDGQAGTGAGYAGDGATVAKAEFHWQQDATPDPDGSLAIHGHYLYVADGYNNRIRRIDLDTGAMECIAGNGTAGYKGDGGSALKAELNDPKDIEFGPDGRLYVADTGNNRIRVIDLGKGTIDTFAGTGQPCMGTPGDPGAYHTLCMEQHSGVQKEDVRFHSPNGIAFDQDGNLYVADTYNSRIVRIAR